MDWDCCCARKQTVQLQAQVETPRRGMPGMAGMDRKGSLNKGALGGVGIVFQAGGEEGGLVVTSLAVDGPAAQSRQVLADDVLVSIDEHNVKGLNPEDLAQYILGPPGSKVRLGFKRQGQAGVKHVELCRGWTMKRSTDSKWSNPLPPNHLLVPGVPSQQP